MMNKLVPKPLDETCELLKCKSNRPHRKPCADFAPAIMMTIICRSVLGIHVIVPVSGLDFFCFNFITLGILSSIGVCEPFHGLTGLHQFSRLTNNGCCVGLA